MEPLNIKELKTSPQVIFDKSKEIFLIKGRSLPENSLSFYEPVINWLTEYINSPNPKTILTIELDYFNSASSKIILQIIQMLEIPVKNGYDIKINWSYQEEDEDILEAGQIYANLSHVPFLFNTIESE
jgi:hypothetical protein